MSNADENPDAGFTRPYDLQGSPTELHVSVALVLVLVVATIILWFFARPDTTVPSSARLPPLPAVQVL